MTTTTTTLGRPNPLIDEYLRHLLEDLRRASTTITTYREILNRMDAEMPEGIEAANADEIKDWINTGDRADATRALYRAAAAGFFKWANDPWREEQYKLTFDPMVMVPTVTVPETEPIPVDDDQVAHLLRDGGEPYRGWFTLAAYGGLRCIEIAALGRRHVTEKALRVHGKGGKRRTVPTHRKVWELVRDLPDGYVVRNSRGAGMTRQGLSIRGGGRIHELGYAELSMHDLRGWFATKAYIASKHNLEVVRRLLGHSSVATTQRYLRFADPARAEAVDGIPELN